MLNIIDKLLDGMPEGSACKLYEALVASSSGAPEDEILARLWNEARNKLQELPDLRRDQFDV